MTAKRRIEELVRERIEIVPYDPDWPKLFNIESDHLLNLLPRKIVKRIEHFGSTAVPGMAAKPIIDILVEVGSLEEAKKTAVPVMQSDGYEYYWRPTIGNDPPYYAWFIKRNTDGARTHHIHMVEADSELWDRLYFRDYLREFPEEASRYSELKNTLSQKYENDRVEYTNQKTKYVVSVTEKAKAHYTASL